MRRLIRIAVVAFTFLSGPAHGADSTLCRVSAKFSSEGSIGAAVTESVRQTKSRILLALYGFNNEALANELVKLVHKGLIVRLKIDYAKSLEKKTARVVEQIKLAGAEVKAVAADGRNHNKFAVIDGARVLTGSYNWTVKAEGNWENLLFLDCPELAQRYEKEWENIH